MDLIDDVKIALRLTTNALDSSVTLLIGAAFADLGLAGVKGDTVIPNTEDPLIKQAVITYCRANFGQPDDYADLKASYDEQKAQLGMATGYTDWGDDA
ncbi:MAG: DNA-packaging protein [Firmicutes bacterium]|nr:DNA-packaging protein [Bacillota bacterium]